MKDKQKTIGEAGEWFLRIKEKDLSLSERAMFLKWLAKDTVNALEYHRMELLWEATSELSLAPSLNYQVKTATETNANHEYKLPANASKTSYSDAIPDVVNKTGSTAVKHAFAIAALFMLVIGLVLFNRVNVSQQPAELLIFESASGQNKTVTLKDGSTIILGGKSKITVRLSDSNRRITMHEGEALFSVFKDNSRPFVVEASGRLINAIGTRFNIHMRANNVTVTVLEGIVEIGSGFSKSRTGNSAGQHKQTDDVGTFTGIARLHALESLEYYTSGQVGTISKTDPSTVTAWQKGKLIFANESLENVIADINRYSDRKIILIDKASRKLRFSGTFFQGNLDEWLSGLEQTLPVRLIQGKGLDVIIIASADNSIASPLIN